MKDHQPLTKIEFEFETETKSKSVDTIIPEVGALVKGIMIGMEKEIEETTHFEDSTPKPIFTNIPAEQNQLFQGRDDNLQLADQQLGKTFTVFRKLPIELRYMIWTMSLPGQRVLEIKRLHEEDDSAPEYRSAARIPTALHVCRESRKLAQRSYSLSFGPSIEDSGRIYFDKEIDVVFLSCCRFRHFSELTRFFMSTSDIVNIRHLSICGKMFETVLLESLAFSDVLVKRLENNMRIQSLTSVSHFGSGQDLWMEETTTPFVTILDDIREALEKLFSVKLGYGRIKGEGGH
ncbi:hypothetical protein EG329_002163 [Mollisiaceae sp. DMI_Dod_QoI]|nr:hypothetical protein EG329_002163 [Helotiales sp. DMI_Dod_QoI]